MSKINTNRSELSRKGKSFKSKDAKKAFKKSFPENYFKSDKKKFDFEKDSKRENKPRQPFSNSSEERPHKKKFDFEKDSKREDKPRRPFSNSSEERPYKKKFDFEKDSKREDKPRRPFSNSSEERPYKKRMNSEARKYAAKPMQDFKGENSAKKRFSKPRPGQETNEIAKRLKFNDFEDGKVFSNATKNEGNLSKPSHKKPSFNNNSKTTDGLMRLNKYLSHAGIASRREADVLIQSGVIKVNGIVINQLGYKISPSDKVTYSDAVVKSERKVYLLLNKPKDYITTVDDPQERKTVMELISKACKERIYPVGRLDRNTTGLLLFTNDGDLTTKLTHPKYGIKKVYHVSLNKGLKAEDFKKITEGIELEDGIVKVDDLAYVGEGKKEIGIEIHTGRNRIVRRLFEHLGYDILKLDRVVFAGLTKKDLPRGKHRFLTSKEISFLKMVS